ncbi:MAG TPA: hypothetical protein DCZ76_03985, partial [Treponema sp.]|nr:hypothetical protein [Treponema sp.]
APSLALLVDQIKNGKMFFWDAGLQQEKVPQKKKSKKSNKSSPMAYPLKTLKSFFVIPTIKYKHSAIH